MLYSVVVSQLAEQQYDNILGYVAKVLKNYQVVNGIADDFDHVVSLLESSPEIFPYARNENLRKLGLHVAHFRNYRYMAIYRIKANDIVVIEGIYHEMQDYENSL